MSLTFMQFSTSRKTYHQQTVWRLAVALTLALSLCFMSPALASAFSIEEYFQLSYDPVTFDKNEIQGSEVFHATIAGRATCTKDLPFPLPISEVSITSQVVAEHAVSGATVTLNSSYTITIKSFPSKEGETAEISQVVPLQFPSQAKPGDYNIIGKIVEAHVNFVLGSLEVTSYLLPEQHLGLVKYTAPEPTVVPTPPSTPPPPAPPTTPLPTPTSIPAPTPTPPEQTITWWAWLIVAVAAATTAINVVWFLRHRYK